MFLSSVRTIFVVFSLSKKTIFFLFFLKFLRGYLKSGGMERSGRVRSGYSKNPVCVFLHLCSVAVLLCLFCFCRDNRKKNPCFFVFFFSSVERKMFLFHFWWRWVAALFSTSPCWNLTCLLAWLTIKVNCSFFLWSRPSRLVFLVETSRVHLLLLPTVFPSSLPVPQSAAPGRMRPGALINRSAHQSMNFYSYTR